MDTETPRLRLSILGIVVFSLFAALFVRLYYLQIMAPDEGVIEAANNRVRIISEEAPRGRILDAKGRVLVDNRTSLVVTIDPHGLKSLKKDEQADLLLRLSEQLTKSGTPTKVSAIERKLADPQFSPLQPVPVAIDVPEDLMVFLAERADEYPSVQVRRTTVRHYPEKSLAAHVVGYVGRISGNELKARMGTKEEPIAAPKPYEPDSSVGKTGVEKSFEDDLRGVPGVKKVEVDRNGKVVRELAQDYRPPIPGNDVQLTIDMDVQRATEAALASQLEEQRGKYTTDGKVMQGKVGSSVVLDPRNGHVVAMASYPTYDPSEFVNGISSDRYDQWTKGDPADNPTINRAIAGLYAPGSTFKLVTAYAALDKGLITGTEYFNDQGFYKVGNREFKNAQNKIYNQVQLPRAITVSSDAYFYALGDRFWKERDKVGDGIQETARKFGYGAATGIDLTGELAGVVPDPAWKKQLWESLPADQRSKSGDGNWYAGDNVNLAIGQGDVLATPLQVADSYAVFANKGTRNKVAIVKRVLKPGVDATDPSLDNCATVDPRCGVVRRTDAAVADRFDFTGSSYDLIHQGLAGVTTEKDGTASALFDGFDQKAWPVMGKTGTAQVNDKADTSLFVGVGPANDPQYVAVAVLEQAGFGSEAAGPVVRKVFETVSGQAKDPNACPAPAAPGAPATSTTTTTSTKGVTPAVCPATTTGAGTAPNTTGATTTPNSQYVPPSTAYLPPTTTYRPPTTAYLPPTSPPPSSRPPNSLPPSSLPPGVPTTKRTG